MPDEKTEKREPDPRAEMVPIREGVTRFNERGVPMSRTRLYAWRQAGRIAFVKIGGASRITLAEIDRVISEAIAAAEADRNARAAQHAKDQASPSRQRKVTAPLALARGAA